MYKNREYGANQRVRETYQRYPQNIIRLLMANESEHDPVQRAGAAKRRANVIPDSGSDTALYCKSHDPGE